jgi:hypothetical protein
VASIGEAFIDVHANTLPFSKELDRDLERAADRADESLERAGTEFGGKIAKSTSRELGRRGKDYGQAIENATRRVTIQIRSIFRFDRIRDAIRRRFRRDVGETISDEVGKALSDAGRPGGPISKLGMAFADAVGAGFNVSGRSPLIALLLPALAALLGLILGLVQAVNALVAVLFIVPGLLASIGLQIGVVAIAFQGMGEAVQGAFAAKNAKELNEALKDLSPTAAQFVRELLPLRDFFRVLRLSVQQSFFRPLLGVITALRENLGPSLITGFVSVAAAAGRFLASFGNLLASPAFVKFFNELVPATVRWLDKFGQGLFGRRGFVTGIIAMATALMPFMEKFGDIILRNLGHLSGLIFNLASNPETQVWLDRMADTLQLVFDLLFKVGEFLFVFMRELDQAGGQDIFKELMNALNLLMFVLASPAGQEAMEGLVRFGIIGIQVLTGLIIVVLGLFAAFNKFAEYLRFSFLEDVAGVLQAIGRFVVNMAVGFINWIARIIIKIGEWLGIIKGLPGRMQAALGSLGQLLLRAGRSLIQGLIDGIRQKLGELFSLIGSIAGRIGGFFGSSPAKEGPLSGDGWTMHRGQRMMQDLTKGIEMEIPDLRRATMEATSNIVFGPNSIQMTIHGPMDQGTARRAGTTMGSAAAGVIAARNTRLAVRTL